MFMFLHVLYSADFTDRSQSGKILASKILIPGICVGDQNTLTRSGRGLGTGLLLNPRKSKNGLSLKVKIILGPTKMSSYIIILW